MAGESDRSQPYDDLNPSKGPRSCRIKSTVDRISALPESVLVHILSFLPIEDAIKTEVLSKRWQYLWTCVPALLFRFRPSHSFDKNCDFVTFVDRTLVLCNGSRVQKFGVDFEYEPRFASNVNLWTRFAARNGTEELHLELHRSAIEDWEMLQDSEFYVLPQLLYTNSLFRELRFSFCGVMPKGVVDWKWLKKLSIGYAKLSDDVIQKILAGSPVLEIVELFCFYGINRLHISNASVKRLILREFWDIDGEPDSLFEISAPNLQSLEFSGHLERKNYRLGDVSSLVDATLDCFLLSYPEDYDDDHEIHRNTLRGLLESLVHVKNLTLGAWAIQILSIMEIKGLRPPLLKCECLTLDMCLTKVELPGIASVLESSPNLETLVITMSPFSNIEILWEKPIRLCNFDEEHYWTSQKRTFNCLMLHLKIVKFAGLRFSDFMFSFVQFLLRNARVLQKIVINTPRKDSKTAKELFQAAQKLLSFPRSSPDAVVMFYE